MLPILTSRCLTLREIQIDDSNALQAFQNRPDHYRLQAMEPKEYADGQRIHRYLEYRGEGPARRLFVFVALETRTGTLLGEIGLSRSYPGVASLGFSVASEHWGKGYASEMGTKVIAFGFEELGLHRITAAVAIENAASCRVLRKIGMTHEGTARECIKAQGRWWSEEQYAILTSDVSGDETGR